MPASYHSRICAIAHSAMEQLFAAGLLDAERMFEFDRLCRTDIEPDTDFAAIQREPMAQASPTQARVVVPASVSEMARSPQPATATSRSQPNCKARESNGPKGTGTIDLASSQQAAGSKPPDFVSRRAAAAVSAATSSPRAVAAEHATCASKIKPCSPQIIAAQPAARTASSSAATSATFPPVPIPSLLSESLKAWVFRTPLEWPSQPAKG